MRTYVPKGKEAEELQAGPAWHVVYGDGQVLGRLATRVARLLIGKDKPQFTPYLDCGDHVVVINAHKIRLTGNKIDQKVYQTHSGYPGGLKEAQLKDVLVRTPDRAIYEAVRGMLPVNKLRDPRLLRLKIYEGAEHNHAAQKPEAIHAKGTK